MANTPQPLSEVRTGQPIRAVTINEIIRNQSRSDFPPSQTGGGMYGIDCQANNWGDAVIPRGYACRISGQAYTSNPQGERQITVNVAGATTGALAIAMDTIEPARGGRVRVTGLAWAQCTGTGDFATLTGASGALALDTTGEVAVLGAVAGWALILLGGGVGATGGGGSDTNWRFAEGD